MQCFFYVLEPFGYNKRVKKDWHTFCFLLQQRDAVPELFNVYITIYFQEKRKGRYNERIRM